MTRILVSRTDSSLFKNRAFRYSGGCSGIVCYADNLLISQSRYWDDITSKKHVLIWIEVYVCCSL